MSTTILNFIPYLGLLPIAWAIFNWFNYFYYQGNLKEKQLLETLTQKSLINKEQKFILDNIQFYDSQKVKIDLTAKLLFPENSILRFFYWFSAAFIGIFWFIAMLRWANFTSYKSIFVYLFFMSLSYIFIHYSRRKIIIDLNSKIITRNSYLFSNKFLEGPINLSKAQITINQKGLFFEDKEISKSLTIQKDLNEYEVVIWKNIIDEILKLS